jgi:hypothetical protein
MTSTSQITSIICARNMEFEVLHDSLHSVAEQGGREKEHDHCRHGSFDVEDEEHAKGVMSRSCVMHNVCEK